MVVSYCELEKRRESIGCIGARQGVIVVVTLGDRNVRCVPLIRRLLSRGVTNLAVQQQASRKSRESY